jgi:hypothetical protein
MSGTKRSNFCQTLTPRWKKRSIFCQVSDKPLWFYWFYIRLIVEDLTLWQMILCVMLHSSVTHSIICTWLFRGKMHSDWFNGIEILQGRWQHGEKGGYCYLSGLENTLCKWDM